MYRPTPFFLSRALAFCSLIAAACAGGDFYTFNDLSTGGTGNDMGASGCGVLACDSSGKSYPEIKAAYDRLGAAAAGKPADSGAGLYVHRLGSGSVQEFSGGTAGPVIIAFADGEKSAWIIQGGIRTAWLAGGSAMAIGYPREDAHPDDSNILIQTFAKACIGPDGTGAWAARTSCAAPPDLAPILTQLRTGILAKSPKTEADFAVEWMPSGQRFGLDPDRAHVAGSAVKWMWTAAALWVQPITAVEPVALPVFQMSDNNAAGQMIDLAGGPDAINAFTTKMLGIPQSEAWLCSWPFPAAHVASSCSSPVSGNNWVTPTGALDFLDAVWKSKGVGAADKRQKLLDWATLSPRTSDPDGKQGGWLGDQLPPAAQQTMYHKAGWLPPGSTTSVDAHTTMNEIGMVQTPNGWYSVAVLVAHCEDTLYWTAQVQGLRWSSCVIYHALAKDVADPFNAGCVAP